MSVLLTGGTGYLGGYALTEWMRTRPEDVIALVRAPDRETAVGRLWHGVQLHVDRATFASWLPRIDIALGDLHGPGLGLDDATRDRVMATATSVLHIAASLNRRSEKACLNTNLRGTLTVVELARTLAEKGRLRRYTHVSTVAVAGERSCEVVQEDTAIDWDRSDYDPYGRTKKFAEHLAETLLAGCDPVFLRPSIVLGDSRRPETTQFDMVRAFCGLASARFVPLKAETRLDIVAADWVGEAIVAIHGAPKLEHRRFHLASGVHSPTGASIAAALAEAGQRLTFLPWLAPTFATAIRAGLALPRGWRMRDAAVLMDVFWPYITYDTVFANDRATAVVGRPPPRFEARAASLMAWAVRNRFRYPHKSWEPM